MKTHDLEFMVCHCLSDCAARVLADERPSKHPLIKGFDSAEDKEQNRRVRKILREHAVFGLRYLWKNGSADQRATVAARVLVWMGRGPIEQILPRIRAREKARLS